MKTLNGITEAELNLVKQVLETEGTESLDEGTESLDEGTESLDEGTESLDEKYAKSMGYTKTEQAIDMLYKTLDPKSNLAKSMKSSGNDMTKEFTDMRKNMDKIIEKWDSMSQFLFSESTKK